LKTARVEDFQAAVANATAQNVVKDAIKQVEDQQIAAEKAERVRIQAVNELAAQTQGLTGATNAQIQSVMALSNAYLASQGGLVGYEAAQLQVEQAQKKLDDLIAGGSIPTSFEYRSATNQLEQAKISAAGAAMKMQADEATLANTLKNEGVGGLVAMQNSLRDTIAVHGDATGAIQGQIDKIQAMIDKANTIPPEKHTDINANDNASPAIDNVINALNRIERTITITINTAGDAAGAAIRAARGYMAGGPVPGSRGTPSLAILHGGEYVLTADEAASMRVSGDWGSGGSGDTVLEFNINVSGVTDPTVGRAVGEQIGKGAADALARRKTVVSARTG
jgi:hypothetical protein